MKNIRVFYLNIFIGGGGGGGGGGEYSIYLNRRVFVMCDFGFACGMLTSFNDATRAH